MACFSADVGRGRAVKSIHRLTAWRPLRFNVGRQWEEISLTVTEAETGLSSKGSELDG